MSQPVLETVSPLPQVARLEDLADAIRDQALRQAGHPGAVAPDHANLPALLASPDFVRRFVLALAAGVAGVLGRHDPRVVAVYSYRPGPALAPASSPPAEQSDTTAIHLLIVVTASSAALHAFLGSLQRALAVSLCALPANRERPREIVLDANIVTQQAVHAGWGLAGLLSAGTASSTQLWAADASFSS